MRYKTSIVAGSIVAASAATALTFGDAALMDIGITVVDWGPEDSVRGITIEAGWWILVNPRRDSPVWIFMIYNS
ncbi:MAG: hypothetical protein AAFW60_02595 [Pseudomonadota bacterium]